MVPPPASRWTGFPARAAIARHIVVVLTCTSTAGPLRLTASWSSRFPTHLLSSSFGLSISTQDWSSSSLRLLRSDLQLLRHSHPVGNDPNPTQRAVPLPALSLASPRKRSWGPSPGGNSVVAPIASQGTPCLCPGAVLCWVLCLDRSRGLGVCNHTLPSTASQRRMSAAAAMETTAVSLLVRSPGGSVSDVFF